MSPPWQMCRAREMLRHFGGFNEILFQQLEEELVAGYRDVRGRPVRLNREGLIRGAACWRLNPPRRVGSSRGGFVWAVTGLSG